MSSSRDTDYFGVRSNFLKLSCMDIRFLRANSWGSVKFKKNYNIWDVNIIHFFKTFLPYYMIACHEIWGYCSTQISINHYIFMNV